MKWLRNLFRRKPRACTCDRCTSREANRSTSPIVSHGLHMWVGHDGEVHYRAKSRIIGP